MGSAAVQRESLLMATVLFRVCSFFSLIFYCLPSKVSLFHLRKIQRTWMATSEKMRLSDCAPIGSNYISLRSFIFFFQTGTGTAGELLEEPCDSSGRPIFPNESNPAEEDEWQAAGECPLKQFANERTISWPATRWPLCRHFA